MLALFAAMLMAASFVLSVQADVLSQCLSDAGVPIDVQSSSTWNSDIAPFNQRLKYTPIAVAVPVKVAHIQSAVVCGIKAGVKVTPKSGGHSYASLGLGGENGHLMIEMDRMYNVTLDPTSNVATVQGGARLGHIATALYNAGKRGFAHGTCPGVGVGGHVLHGGYGMSSHLKGLALDWMIGATVVLANGTLVNCSASQNSELFWGLRGAGASFGIVASFQFNTFDVSGQFTTFSVPLSKWSSKAAALDGMKQLQNFANTTMSAELTMRLFINHYVANAEGVYFGNAAGFQQAIAPVLAISGTSATSQTVGWMDAIKAYANGQALDQTTPYSIQETFYASSLVTKSMSDATLGAFADYWFGQGYQTSHSWWIQIDFHGGAHSAVTSVPTTATSYAHRDKLLLFQFYDSAYGTFPAGGQSFLKGFVSNVTGTMQTTDWGMYINYADSELDQATAQNVYWRDQLPRLKKLKGLVDSSELFYSPQSVRP